MVKTILIAGATGNTGHSVVETLPKLLASSNNLSSYRVIALTRSLQGPVAQSFAKLPNVEVIEQNWVEVTADWLRKHEVIRAFIASHNEPNQFAEESTFHHALLKAGVEYVVRISTAAPNVRPDCEAYYPRSHWAIEALLGSAEFSPMAWTSLQPNIFSPLYFAPALEFISQFRKTGKQDTLSVMASEDAPVGIIDPTEVGVFAAHLLALDDPAVHNKAKYVMNGPEDITGAQLVGMVEQQIGTRVENVSYKDLSYVDAYIEPRYEGQSKNVISSVRHALKPAWEGKCSAATTSKGVLELAAPKRAPADVWKDMLEG